MGIRRGSISTPIIADGLVFNMDAANRASYPKSGTIITNTISNTTGSLINDHIFLVTTLKKDKITIYLKGVISGNPIVKNFNLNDYKIIHLVRNNTFNTAISNYINDNKDKNIIIPKTHI